MVVCFNISNVLSVKIWWEGELVPRSSECSDLVTSGLHCRFILTSPVCCHNLIAACNAAVGLDPQMQLQCQAQQASTQ